MMSRENLEQYVTYENGLLLTHCNYIYRGPFFIFVTCVAACSMLSVFLAITELQLAGFSWIFLIGLLQMILISFLMGALVIFLVSIACIYCIRLSIISVWAVIVHA